MQQLPPAGNGGVPAIPTSQPVATPEGPISKLPDAAAIQQSEYKAQMQKKPTSAPHWWWPANGSDKE
jgi:hypothetical protein